MNLLSEQKEPTFANFKIEYQNEGKIAILSFNRPHKMNALTFEQFGELNTWMNYLGREGSQVRVIVLKGEGKHFMAGIDLNSAMELQILRQKGQDTDPARGASTLFQIVDPLQKGLTCLEKVRVPVIAAIHGYCIGAAVDLISACDVRICTSDAKFSIKEVDLGLATDIGSLQRVQKVTKQGSWVSELALTGRAFGAQEAF